MAWTGFNKAGIALALMIVAFTPTAISAADQPSGFTWRNGITNTRHNLTQSGIDGQFLMNMGRNDYGEVCVYCHTPHGAAEKVKAPLWNRTSTKATFTTYDAMGSSTLQGKVSTPGPNSLTCLSCHDGTVAIDSIINMPGSGNYLAAQEDGMSNAFLESWKDGANAFRHQTLSSSSGSESCLSCHDGTKEGAPDFRIAVIGTDLRDDHPIGVSYGGGTPGFKDLSATKGRVGWIESGATSGFDKSDIRVYDSGEGFEVECASCHDPHGVENNGQLMRTFLRVSNEGSNLCLTCHIN